MSQERRQATQGQDAHGHAHGQSTQGQDVYGHAHTQARDFPDVASQRADGARSHAHGQALDFPEVASQRTDGARSHAHTHTHDPRQVKAVVNRISRAIGHLESIRRMVEQGRDCSEVLIQLSAVKAAINNTGKVILQEHMRHCMVDAVQTGDLAAIEELSEAIDRFIK